MPRIFAGLLDVISTALANIGSVRLSEAPRMADFAKWVTAAEPALGWPQGAFMESYAANREYSDRATVEGNPVGLAIVKLMNEETRWSGTMTELKTTLRNRYRRAIDLFINPAIGNFKIVDVERKDVAELHHKFRDKPYQANRTLGVLSKMFNLSEIWGLRPDGSNPCRHVPKYREVKRERYLSQVELQRLGQVLAEVEQDGSETPYIVAAFRLLILTGCRLGEIQTLQWGFITDNGMELPDTKTGARRIPLVPILFGSMKINQPEFYQPLNISATCFR